MLGVDHPLIETQGMGFSQGGMPLVPEIDREKQWVHAPTGVHFASRQGIMSEGSEDIISSRNREEWILTAFPLHLSVGLLLDGRSSACPGAGEAKICAYAWASVG